MNQGARLFLVDGFALIYRAFFAMIARPLRTSRGENTSAVWGVANFLHRLRNEYAPSHAAWVHDSGTSFRTTLFPEYKATRTKLDDELQEDFDRSVERVTALLDAFGVPLVEVEGYEADDVIGTLAARAGKRGMPVVIVSGDKDFYQLISSGIALLNPGRRGPAAVDEQVVDVSNAAERFGVGPERIVDYLALVGDSSDNVPGVRGIGDKTARKLIQEYGDLERILAHAGEIEAKRVREALLSGAESARLSRELVTLRRDVPLELDLEALRLSTPNEEALRSLYAELEFHSLASRLDDASRVGVGQERRGESRLVSDPGLLADAVREMRQAGSLAVDVSAVERGPARSELVGLAVVSEAGVGWYFPFAHGVSQVELGVGTRSENLPPLSDARLGPLKDLLEDRGAPKVAHDVKRQVLRLRGAGVRLAGVVHDTMLASFLLDPGKRSHDLQVLAQERLKIQLPAIDLESDAHRPAEEIAEAACGRCRAVLRLRQHMEPELAATGAGRLLEEIELPVAAVLVEMELRGIGVDTEILGELGRRFAQELEALEGAIHEEAGVEFNINSTQQLRHILFEKLNLPVVKRTKTGPSTDADVLASLAEAGFDLPRLLLEYRELSKLKSTYVDALAGWVEPSTGRIHTSFNQTGAATGRLSSSDPNLQNIPVRTPRGEQIRRCFVPAKGWRFIVADYSQIELRLLAHLSGDEAFVAAFHRGGDIHRETAAVIFSVRQEEVTPEMRARAKTINFATIYGQGAHSLSRQLGISQQEAKQFIRLYFERFSGVRRFLDETIERARDRGYVETLFGRRRYVPELRDPTHNIRAFGERVAMNSPLQGSAADLIKMAMIRVSEAIYSAELPTALLLQVHDELVLEAPREAVDRSFDIISREMEGIASLNVPLVVEIGVGENWLDAKP
ncbi:MAG: DNA polymerase I [Gemmatimonadales bacterium]